tara:strand:- start:2779 stop:3234 length:456 start_codon:yes stop_codon:yes gene_type:complete
MANPFALKALRIGAKTIKNVIKKNRKLRKGSGGDKIPNDLTTRPKAGKRGTLKETSAEREARIIKRKDELGVIRGKGPKVSQSDLSSTGSTYAKPRPGGQQLPPGSRRPQKVKAPKGATKQDLIPDSNPNEYGYGTDSIYQPYRNLKKRKK